MLPWTILPIAVPTAETTERPTFHATTTCPDVRLWLALAVAFGIAIGIVLGDQ
jgi:hypothetical protein